jgi:hypothetical protein
MFVRPARRTEFMDAYMARPQVADGGDGLHLWRVDANRLNKKPQIKVVLKLGVGRGANNRSP